MKKILFLLFTLNLFSQFEERIVVRLIEVPVQVTDKEGNLIVDLKKDDFELYVDKQPHPITHFYEIKESTIANKEFADFLQERGIKIKEPISKKRLFILIDDQRVIPNDFKRNLNALINFINTTLKEGDEISIFSISPSLKELFPLSPNIKEAIKLLSSYSPSGILSSRWLLESKMLEDTIARQSFSSSFMRLRSFVEEKKWEIESTIENLKAFYQNFSGLEGRKISLLLSEGYPTIPGIEFFYQLEKRFPQRAVLNESINYDLSPAFQELAYIALNSNFVIYSLDTKGLTPFSGMDSEYGSLEDVYGADLTDVQMGSRSKQATLKIISNITGGQAIVNQNDPSKPLSSIALGLNNYYIIGFQSTSDENKKLHTIEVKLKNPEFTLSYFKNFKSFSEDLIFEQKIGSFYYIEKETKNPLNIKASFGKSEKEGKFYKI
ncbi:MAG: VWA domain-containing protein, partial [Thermoanaerobaculia bacterium]